MGVCEEASLSERAPLPARKLLLRAPGRVGPGCGAEAGCEGVC